MTIYKGNNKINKLYLGPIQINKVYLGDALILGSNPDAGGGDDTTKYSYNNDIITSNNGVDLDGTTGMMTFQTSSSYFDITLPTNFLTRRGSLILVFKQTGYPSSNPYLYKIGSSSGGTFTYSSRAYISASDHFIRWQVNGSNNTGIKKDEINTDIWYGCIFENNAFNSMCTIAVDKGLNDTWINEDELDGYSLSTTDNILRIGSNNQNTIIDATKSYITYYAGENTKDAIQYFVI